MPTQLQRIQSTQLRLNKELPWSLYDEEGHLLLGRGKVLERNEKIEAYLKRGVFVESSELTLYNYPSAPAAAPARAQQAAPVAAASVRVDPFQLREAMTGRLSLLLRDGLKDAEFVAKIKEIAGVVQMLSTNHADPTLATIFLLDHTKYAISHSIDTALLAAILMPKLDWSAAQQTSVLCAALTMNIGMLDAQTIFAQQRTPLTDAQRAAIASHPTVGANVLRAAGVTDELWLRIVEDHHQVPDGSGYPGGKKDFDQEALLVRTLDIYTAILTPRPTRKAVDTAQAARTLFVQESKHQNPLVGLLVKELGLYPPGAYVKLKNGDTAVVSKRATATTPVIAHAFVNGQGLPTMQPVPRDTSRPEFAVSAALARDAVATKLDFSKIWLYR